MIQLQTTDESGKILRPTQQNIISWLQANLKKGRTLGIDAPPGTGKTLIARLLQRSTHTVLISSNNILVDKYAEEYNVTPVKGQNHYKTKQAYTNARDKARAGHDCVFNTMSYFYFRLTNPKFKPAIVVVDEAHKLEDLLYDLACIRLDVPSLHTFQELKTKGIDETLVYKLLNNYIRQLDKELRETKIKDDQLPILERLAHLRLVRTEIEKNPQNFTYDLVKSARSLPHKPIYEIQVTPQVTPQHILKTLLNADCVVMMSGTLPEPLFNELAVTNDRLHMTNPYETKPENMPIRLPLLDYNDRGDVTAVAQKVKKILNKHPDMNTLIHSTYSASKGLAEQLPVRTITHNKSNKKQAIHKFKQEGGVLIGCGMSEGIDLPGSLCEVVIIPTLIYPYLGDDFVRRKLVTEGGQTWYNLRALTTVLQQIGRGCRSAEDHCFIYILDPMFPKLVRTMRAFINPSILKAIQWSVTT